MHVYSDRKHQRDGGTMKYKNRKIRIRKDEIVGMNMRELFYILTDIISMVDDSNTTGQRSRHWKKWNSAENKVEDAFCCLPDRLQKRVEKRRLTYKNLLDYICENFDEIERVTNGWNY